MKRHHLSVSKPFLLTMLFVCASTFSFGARGKVGAQQQQQQPSSQKLYEAAKRQWEAHSYGKALETIEELLKSDKDYAPALLLKYRALVGVAIEVPPVRSDEVNITEARRERKIRQAKFFKEAADSLERFLQLQPEDEMTKGYRAQLEALRVYAEPALKDQAEWTFFSPTEVTQKARIIRRPEPRYPEEAREARLSGTVKMLIVLAADGTVRHIFVFQGSHRLLTESAIEAAQNIVFEPAIKDGRPVSTATSIEYNFRTY